MIRRALLPSTRRALAIPFVGLLLFAACGDDDEATPTTPAPAPTPAPTPTPDPEPTVPETATYDIEYRAAISSNPLLQALGATPFPEGVGTAPPLAMIQHADGVVLWEEGGIASDGLKTLAESGESAAFIAEAEAAGGITLMSHEDELTALLDVLEITLTLEAPCATFAQMIAPSPDWFFGFSSVCALDEDGNWLETIELTSVAYDAGTAEGEEFEFKAEGDDTDPRVAITELDKAPFSPPGTPLSVISATLRTE